MSRPTHFALALASVMFIVPVPSAAAPRQIDERVTTATGVRVRTAPASSAAEAGKLPLGTLIVVVDESIMIVTVPVVAVPIVCVRNGAAAIPSRAALSGGPAARLASPA